MNADDVDRSSTAKRNSDENDANARDDTDECGSDECNSDDILDRHNIEHDIGNRKFDYNCDVADT